MNYYIDIRILQDPNFAESILMSELVLYLHKAFNELGKGDIGISFPKVNKTLGNLLRLHGDLPALQRLMLKSWIGGLKDYITISDITPIPEVVNYRIVKRVQAKSSSERLRRRSVRKGWLTKEEADLKILDSSEKKLSLPYLRLKSRSTDQLFCLFVEHGPLLSEPIHGIFSAYGLSSTVTIPWFGP